MTSRLSGFLDQESKKLTTNTDSSPTPPKKSSMKASRLNDFVPKEEDTKKETKSNPPKEFTEIPATNFEKNLKASSMVKDMKLINNGTEDDLTKLQNFPRTNFPRNTPCFIVGPKGSGKTYLLAALLQKQTHEGNLHRVFYMYANNVDTTITRALGNYDFLFQVPKHHAMGFLIKFLNKKTKFTTAYRFLNYSQLTDLHKELPPNASIRDLKHAHWYWDNKLEEWSYQKHLKTYGDVHTYCKKVYSKYTKNVVIHVGTLTLNVGKFEPKQYDMVVMDDIAQFNDLLAGTRTNSPLYQFFTITRQNLTTFYLTGQEVKQLPLMYREQLGGAVMMHGTEDYRSLKVPKHRQKEIQTIMLTLSEHEGILFNFNDNQLEVIRN